MFAVWNWEGVEIFCVMINLSMYKQALHICTGLLAQGSRAGKKVVISADVMTLFLLFTEFLGKMRHLQKWCPFCSSLIHRTFWDCGNDDLFVLLFTHFHWKIRACGWHIMVPSEKGCWGKKG